MELSLWERHLLEELKVFEGLRLEPYNDHLGYATIGYGHLIAKRGVTAADKAAYKGFTKEDAEVLLLEDMIEKIEEVGRRIPFFNGLDSVRKTVLVGMAFQMGVDGLLKFKDTLKAIDQGRYRDAGIAMSNSLWARQTPSRAKILVERMISGKF